MFSYKTIVKKLSKDYMVEEIEPGFLRVAGVKVCMEDFSGKPERARILANTITFSLVRRESAALASKEVLYSVNAIRKYVEEMK